MTLRSLFRKSQSASKVEIERRVLVASEGRRFNNEIIDLAAGMVRNHGGHVRVLTIARLWGTAFGLPNPGLRPSKREMAEQEDNVAWAIHQLEDAGVSADGHIVTTRNPRKSILLEAKRQKCGAIIMSADPRRTWIVGNLMWSQEPYRVRRRAPIPVHLVCPVGRSS